MNKKFRDIRSTQYCTNKGIFDPKSVSKGKPNLLQERNSGLNAFIQTENNQNKFKLTGSAASLSDLHANKQQAKRWPMTSHNMRSRKNLISQGGTRISKLDNFGENQKKMQG